MALNERETGQLRAALQEAVVKCSERCLYQSAKWYYDYMLLFCINDVF
jgi:anaphase-promoting complex subunit 8